MEVGRTLVLSPSTFSNISGCKKAVGHAWEVDQGSWHS
jgi:hypothetical protein